MTMAAERTATLPPHIRSWVAKTLVSGYSPQFVSRKLAEKGYAESATAAEIAEVTGTTTYAAAVELAKSRDKLAQLLDTLAHQFRRSSASAGVPAMDHPDPGEFFDRYYYGNRPVLVRGLMEDWPALGKWTPEWLAKTHGEVTVEVASGRDGDPRYEENFQAHRTTMRLADFIAAISTSSGNDLYLESKNRMLDRPELADLLDDFSAPPGFLRPTTRRPGLWLGPGGTITPLHHDATNVFFAQVHGAKRVRLIPPCEINNVYNDRACYSAIDIDAPDLAKHPRFEHVAVLDTTVSAGEFLLIPVGWWHTVESLSTSISMSFHNFATDDPPVVWRWRDAGLRRLARP